MKIDCPLLKSHAAMTEQCGLSLKEQYQRLWPGWSEDGGVVVYWCECLTLPLRENRLDYTTKTNHKNSCNGHIISWTLLNIDYEKLLFESIKTARILLCVSWTYEGVIPESMELLSFVLLTFLYDLWGRQGHNLSIQNKLPSLLQCLVMYLILENKS